MLSTCAALCLSASAQRELGAARSRAQSREVSRAVTRGHAHSYAGSRAGHAGRPCGSGAARRRRLSGRR
eukprot:2029522-Rhodomonas_salina.1